MATYRTAENPYWVHIHLADGELQPHGPFTDQTEAEAAAARVIGICRTLHQPATTSIVQQPTRRRA